MPEEGSFEERGGWVLNALAEDFDLSMDRAAGVVGNLGFESGGFKSLQEIRPAVSGSRGGYGWAQWTGPRRRKFEAWCSTQNLDPSSDEANYGYLCDELDTTHAYCLDAVRKEVTLERAVFVFGRLFEAPGGTTEDHLPGYEGRLRYARRALAGAKEQALRVPPPAPAPAVLSFFDRIRKRLGL